MERLEARHRRKTEIDDPAIRAQSIALKLDLTAAGYVLCHSLWENIRRKSDGVQHYVRIEVWIKGPTTERTYYELKAFFEKYPPPFEYSIWTYDVLTDEIKIKGGWKRW